MDWITSSYSGYNGNCVEVAFAKSSYSGANNCVEVGYAKSSHSVSNHCVEVGGGQEGVCGLVHVRDSKDPGGGVLSFSPGVWMEFLDDIRTPLVTKVALPQSLAAPSRSFSSSVG